MSLLDISKLTMRFGGLTAVSNLELYVPPNEIVSIIGPNGAGKTTVFNAISGIYEPTSGRIEFLSRETRRAFSRTTALVFAFVGILTAIGLTVAVNIDSLWEAAITSHYQYRQSFPWRDAVESTHRFFAEDLSGRFVLPYAVGLIIGAGGAFAVWQRSRRAPEVVARRGIGRTFQNIRLFKQMSVLDNVLLGMDPRLHTNFWHVALRLPLFWREQQEAVQNATDILRFLGLDKESSQFAEHLSYGHQRRLEIARALAMSPRLLLLDEPAAGMNPAEAQALMQLIRQIRERGVTVLLIEHHMRVVMGISDRIAVLDHGEKIAEGTPREVCENPKVIEAYLGKANAEA